MDTGICRYKMEKTSNTFFKRVLHRQLSIRYHSGFFVYKLLQLIVFSVSLHSNINFEGLLSVIHQINTHTHTHSSLCMLLIHLSLH